jgi:MFS family permease
MSQPDAPARVSAPVTTGTNALGTSGWYPPYALGVLFVVYVFNFIDRSILNILAEPIKQDLGLYDWQIGLMGGLAFAFFYTTLGIPIARLADTRNRRNIIAICLTIWSAMTAVCGLAQNFWQLLLARVGVAVGEAGGSPPAHSMISDLFAADRRATALGIYALGIPVGTMLGNLAGGWINEVMDWRTAFIVVGLPGVLLALLLRFTVREPPRGVTEHAIKAKVDAPPVGFVFKALWSRKSFRYMALGGALHALVGYGVGPFVPPLFIRVHGMTTGELGTALFWLGFAGILGTALGGYFADKLGVRDVRWYVWLPGLAILISLPFSTAVYLWPDPIQALIISAIPGFLGAYYLGPTFSLAQGLVGIRMRALAAAILLFILNLIGMGLGPLYVGIASDLLNAYTNLGVESVRWALVSVLIFNLLSALFYLIAGRDLKSDLARSHELS